MIDLLALAFVIIFVMMIIIDDYVRVGCQYPHKQGVKGYIKYLKNELSHKLKGDKRCEFKKLVDRCRILESSRIIYNPGQCSDPQHQH
ncbi:MAG: hypothetical protein V3T98_01380 [Candidatus Paceibacterota bacterium]